MKAKPSTSSVPPLKGYDDWQSLYSDIFNAVQDGLSVIDAGLNIALVNSWMEKMYAAEMPMVGRKCYAAYQRRKKRCPWCPSVKAMETGQVHTAEVPYPSAKKPTGWIGLTAYPLRSSSGKIAGVIEHVKDITEEKRAELRLRESEERYRRLVDLAPDGIVLIDVKGRVIEVNSAFAELSGHSREEIAGKHFSNLPTLVAKEIPGYVKMFLSLLTGKIPPIIPFEYITKSGQHRWAEARISRVEVEGKTLGLLGLLRDVTERMETERELKERDEQLRQSQKMEAVGRLAGGIAHDFNNLLTAIRGYAELLENDPNMDKQNREWISDIRRSAERAASLTGQLLAFSRKQIMKPQILSLNKLVKNTETMLQRVIGEDIDLLICCDPKTQLIKADPGQLEQVIINLAVNSRDAMPKGGRLRIETEDLVTDEQLYQQHGVSPGRYTHLSVTDTGAGIGEEIVDSIFEPFFTTKPSGKGTGLGLSTVYGIVKQSGGFIWVDSRVGLGTTVHILFPVAGEKPAGSEAPAGEEVMKGGNETILIIEDEEAVRKMVTRILTRLGYSVLEAGNGQDALKLLEAEDKIDLVITDVVMPTMSGPDLVSRITELNPGIRTLYMSGYPDEAIAHHGIIEEGITFLEKPFSPQALTSLVRQLLDGS
jgi:two-component system cell cycle sensor histidine kinase/response regulator CckA